METIIDTSSSSLLMLTNIVYRCIYSYRNLDDELSRSTLVLMFFYSSIFFYTDHVILSNLL